MKLTSITIFLIFFLKCSSNTSEDFSIKIDSNSKKLTNNDSINLSINNNKNYLIDSVHFFLNEEKINQIYSLKNLKLGSQSIKASIFSNGENIIKQTNIKIFADSPPILYTYEILNEYPHDQEAYTQGLEFYNDTLYESTGLKGKSTIRKLNYKTGEIYSIQPLDAVYFGEGLTFINDKLIQLTWREGIGFQYDPITLEIERSFSYDKSKEGWGLCNDGEKIYKSDGTNLLWILDSKTQKEIEHIQVMTNKSSLNKINELEYVNGKIFANTYQFDKDVAVIIDPKNGMVEGVIDFSGLKNKVNQHPKLDVLNGIAYNKKSKTFFITGKNWNKLFELNIYKKN